MRKPVFGHTRAAKAQISLRISAVRSESLLSADKIIEYYRMYEWTEIPGWYFAHPQDFAHVRKHFFLCGPIMIDG